VAEGDSILRLARRLDLALAGSTVSVRTPGPRRPDGRPASALDGRVLKRSESRGKHLLLHFSDGLVLHSHLGMKGAWHLYRAGERWRKPARAAWIALGNGAAEAVNFNGTAMRIVSEAELGRDPRLRRLGPDLLADDFDLDRTVASLRAAGAATEVGEALLDQGAAAGIGNIFKSEGCWAVRLDPWAKLADLEDDALSEVLTATRELMLDAVETGRQPKRVYRRAGMPCSRCRTPIRSRGQGDSARVTYWCPACQVKHIAQGSPTAEGQRG
jgi:endonuclease-8